jgi:hypothetical protein
MSQQENSTLPWDQPRKSTTCTVEIEGDKLPSLEILSQMVQEQNPNMIDPRIEHVHGVVAPVHKEAKHRVCILLSWDNKAAKHE